MKKLLEAFFGSSEYKEKYYAEIDRNEAIENNYVTIRFFSLISGICIVFMLLATRRDSHLGQNLAVYWFGEVFCIVIYFLNEVIHRWKPQAVILLVYLSVITFLGYGLTIGVFTTPESQTVTFMVLMIFAPMLFIDRPWRMSLCVLIMDMLFVVLAQRNKSGDVLETDVMDAFVFGILAVLSIFYMMNVKYARYVTERKLHELSTRDTLTGLKNRTAYESAISALPEICRAQLAIQYVDANGLHEINDTKGHEEGDRMLKTVADEMQRVFGPEHCYRIGGDEFVAFCPDETEAEMKAHTERFQTNVASCGYSCACGFAVQSLESCSVEELIKQAEQAMYADKSRYYIETKKDRRTH